MRRAGNPRRHTPRWMAVVVPLLVVVLAAGGAAAAVALTDRSGGSHAGHGRSVATTTGLGAAAAASANSKSRRKPRRTTTTTSSSTTTSTTTPPPTTAPGLGLDVKVPLPGFGGMLVDEARGRVYLSGGKDTNSVVVTDLDGGIQQTVGIGRGGGGMTLSPDGTKLYVALVDSDGIAIIDLATYAVEHYYVGTHDGVPTCPRDVAWVAGQLWFGWGCDNAPAGIGKVDPQTRAYDLGMAAYPGVVDSRIATAPLLATVPSQPNMLIAGVTGSNPALLFRFEVTPTGLEQRAWRWTDGGSVRQLAVTPDGSQVIVPSGSPYYHPVLRTSDLTEVHRYPTTHYPNAAAVRSDGLVAAGINGAYDEDVYVFEPGGSTPIATFEFGHLPGQETWAHTLVDGGLAWHGDRIYAVTEQLSEPDNVTLRIRTLG
jgi:DNA-binding beta-propeller fold protein YncE